MKTEDQILANIESQLLYGESQVYEGILPGDYEGTKWSSDVDKTNAVGAIMSAVNELERLTDGILERITVHPDTWDLLPISKTGFTRSDWGCPVIFDSDMDPGVMRFDRKNREPEFIQMYQTKTRDRPCHLKKERHLSCS